VASLRQRLADVASLVAGRRRPAVAVVEWVDPPFQAGHCVPDLVVAAGGRPVAACQGGRSVQTSWDAIAAARPDVVVVAPCGFGLDEAAAQAELVAGRLPGVPVWAIDANGLVVRPGPRLVDGVEALAQILHPGRTAAVPAGRIQRIS
jgi:iron complex transport system substrate-binding protein